MPLRRLLVVGICALAALVSPAVAQAKDLFGTVGPDFTISLRDDQGSPVTNLDPGDYRIVIEDRSEFHNFHLIGPGVDRATDIEAIGTVTFEVTLVEGRYRFICDPHESLMRGAFTVGNPPPLPSPPPRLIATVGPRATISLTRNGARVRSLPAGTYTIVVRDRSRRHNFHLSGAGLNRKTAVRGMSTVTWTVTFQPGAYLFRSDPQARKLRGTFSVTQA